MNKLTIRKIILAHFIATLSFTAMSQSTFAPVNYSKSVVEEKPSYYDQKDLTSNYVSWGINPNNPASINLLSAWQKFKKKKDIVVAVVDTGIDREHPFLENNIFVETGKVDPTNFGVDFSKDKKAKGMPTDNHGHGTHVSGIIKSIYPDVKILALKYYNPNASGVDNLNSTVEALRYAVDHNVDVINYSGGGPEPAAEELRVLKEAERKGILVVAAAGNEESNIDDKRKAYFPASYGLKNIITVTAHDEDLKILNSSNYGRTSVDIFAPGYRIKSSLQNGRTGYLTGTSQATAFVTGVAALIKAEYPQLSTERIKEIIKASAKKEMTMEGKCATGGRLDAGSALALAAQYSGENETRRQVANTEAKEGKIIYRIAN
jgi:subtilisin family serine protease